MSAMGVIPQFDGQRAKIGDGNSHHLVRHALARNRVLTVRVSTWGSLARTEVGNNSGAISGGIPAENELTALVALVLVIYCPCITAGDCSNYRALDTTCQPTAILAALFRFPPEA